MVELTDLTEIYPTIIDGLQHRLGEVLNSNLTQKFEKTFAPFSDLVKDKKET